MQNGDVLKCDVGFTGKFGCQFRRLEAEVMRTGKAVPTVEVEFF